MNSKTNRRRTRSATAILSRLTGPDPELRGVIETRKLETRIAEMILRAREREGLTQAQLAERVGTTQSVISRLEDADYDGHSLSMLRRVAAALHHRVELKLVRETTGPGGMRRGRASRQRARA